MEEIEITIYLEDRCMTADLPKGGTIIDLMVEFDEICKMDVTLTQRRLDFGPTFSLIYGQQKKEIKRRYAFQGGEDIYVGWSSLSKDHVMEPQLPIASTPTHERSSHDVREVNDNLPRLEPSNNLVQTTGDGAEFQPSDDESETLQGFVETDLSQFGSKTNNALSRSPDLFASTPSTSRNVSTVQDVVHIVPSSSSSSILSTHVESSASIRHSEDSGSGSEVDDPRPAGEPSENNTTNNESGTTKRKAKTRAEYRKPNKKVRQFDEVLNRAKSLPNFSEMVKNQLDNNEVKMRAILPEIRAHINSKTRQKQDNSYFESWEMDLLCESLIKEYPILADPDSNGEGSSLLRGSILKSNSSLRYNERNKQDGIPRPSRAKPKPAETPQPSRNQPSTSSESDLESWRNELKLGVRDAKRLKWLIYHTYKERLDEFIQTDNKLATIKLYPHLRDGRVLIYEYLLNTNVDSKVADNNCRKLMNVMSTFLNVPQHTVDGSLEILTSIQDMLLPRQLVKQVLRKAITFKDATQVDRSTLSQLNLEQAPCIVTTVTTTREGTRAISQSVVLMHNDVINIYKEPNVCQVLKQLMACYWVFDIKYPKAYESFLRLLEKWIHGELSAQTKRTKAKQEYVSITRSLDSLSLT